ncbi:MAG: DHH family phosphoesterase [Methanomicrobiales archaeon]|nr:DHH family phosphoesterase [Methanomicrobiales archaeon]
MQNVIREAAEHLRNREFVEIFAHHDVDGIAAAAILCHALHRAGGGFRVRIVSDISPDLIKESPHAVLCDIGSGMTDLPESAIVIDHHVPHFTAGLHVNPRLSGIDGARQLSAAGMAYLVAREMGENTDLVGLAVLGILGDGQEIEGKNREIVHEGIARQYLSTSFGFLLPGRDLVERLFLAIDPYLEGISGNEERCRSIVAACTESGETNEEALVSRVLLEISPQGSLHALQGIFGTRYSLEREALSDAHTLASLIDACGKMGRGGLGVELCLRYPGAEPEARSLMAAYRGRVIETIRRVKRIDERSPWFEVLDPQTAGNVADALAFDLVQDRPVAVFSMDQGMCRISLRTPEQVSFNLEPVVRGVAAECGGCGGGHETRAGAVVGMGQIECFKNGLRKAMTG